MISLDDLNVKEKKDTSAEIIRGIAAKFMELGAQIGGFDMYCTSDVLIGSGISSSAAFEILACTIIDSYYNGNKSDTVEIAKKGQYAENIYFGKKSGLMDQVVSSVGGLVFIDLHDTENPEIKNLQFDFEKSGYCLCITDTKGSHSGLTDDYAAVRAEMESVAEYFGKEYLRDVNENDFYSNIAKIRERCGDRAILRTAHFFNENIRAKQEYTALTDENMEYFFELVRQSGDSSANLLQNLYSVSDPHAQAIPIGIMLSKHILGGKGAVRVHGGGFAGTIQAFVPISMVQKYAGEMNRIYGENSCYILSIRPVGGIEITK